MRDPQSSAIASQPAAAPLVRAELDRILASEVFARSERLSSFLRFIVERTLSGDAESLKEQVIAIELYGKDPAFDTAADPIVRVDARRLRDKLREYYASAGDAALVISVPKGGYTPVFLPPVPGSVACETAPPASSVVRRWPIAAAVLVLLAALMWLTRFWIGAVEAPRQIAVTSSPGAAEDAALSPDGRSYAFSWSPSDDVNHRIVIKLVASEGTVYPTNKPDANEEWPRWSHDGQWITFSRRLKEGGAVIKVSALGGPETTIATFASDADWTPDGHALVMRWRTPEGHVVLAYHELDTDK